MLKKVKCLLVAGLLVLGMGGKAFAAEPLVSTITNPQFEEGANQKEFSLQHGYINVTLIKDDDGKYDVVVKWDKTVLNVIKVESKFEDGDNLISDLNTCYDVEYEGDNVIVTIEDVNIGPEAFGSPNYGKLIGVNIYFELVDSDGDGVPDFKDNDPVVPPEEPEPPVEEPKEKIEDPETGDSSILLVVGTAAASLGGLYVLTRKKEDK